MKLGKLGLQHVLISEKSYQYVHELWRKDIPHSNEYDAFREKTLQDYIKQKEQDDKNHRDHGKNAVHQSSPPARTSALSTLTGLLSPCLTCVSMTKERIIATTA